MRDEIKIGATFPDYELPDHMRLVDWVRRSQDETHSGFVTAGACPPRGRSFELIHLARLAHEHLPE
jgi:hypothetical protein